jgi:hypothetical protein
VSPEPDPSTVVRRGDRALAEQVAGETVLLDAEGDVYLRLNPSGTRLWEALENPTPIAELALLLELEYDLDPQVALADAVAFVAQMSERGLIETGGA